MEEDYLSEEHYNCSWCDKYYCYEEGCHCLDGLEEKPKERK
jgi:hypothetical protein